MNKLSKADKMQIKLMSELEESKYTYKQVKKFWNNYEIDPTKKQKKSDKILDKLFDLACQKHPAEMGMVGYEFKNEEEMMTAINKKNLTIEGIPKKNIKQTGGMNYYKLFNKIITEPCNGPHCTIPVKPEVSNMINNNLKSANPPPGALTQYPGTDRIGNNSMQMPGVSNYIGTPLNNGSFNIKCTGQKGGVLISEPCSGPHCAIPVEPTTSNMINNNLKSANPPLDAFTQYPGTNRLGNNTDSMPGISDYVGTTLNHGPFNIKCTEQKAGAKQPTFDSVYNSNKYKDKTFRIDRDLASKVMSLNSPYKTTFQEDFNDLMLLTEYIIEGLKNNQLGIRNTNSFQFKTFVKDLIDNWGELGPPACYQKLLPKLEYYFDLLIKEKIIVEFEPFIPNGGGLNIKCTGQKAGTTIDEIDIEVLDTKPTFDSVYNNNKYKDKVFHIDRDKADELMSLNSHYEDIFLQDNNNLKLLVEYITEGIDNTELGFDDSNNFYFKSVVQEFIEYWDEFDECYHKLVPNLEYYFDLLIKEKILVEFEQIIPNGGGFNDLYSGDNQGTFFSQQKPFKTIGGGFTGISSGDNQGTFYSNIRCPKSGISYNISSKMGINILKNYILTLKGGSPWVTHQSPRAFEIMEKVLEEILHKCNNDNDKKILYQDIKSISESNDLDDQLYEYCIEKFMDELVDYNLRFNGDARFIIQEHTNYEIFEKIKKNLQNLE